MEILKRGLIVEFMYLKIVHLKKENSFDIKGPIGCPNYSSNMLVYLVVAQ